MYVIDADPVEREWIASALAGAVDAVVHLERWDALPAAAPDGGTRCLITSVDPGGAEALRMVRGLRRRGMMLPVIALGPHTAFREAVDIARIEATDFLERPVGKRELRTAVRRACK